MAVSVSEIRPGAHLPLGLGMWRKLDVAAVIDEVRPPHPATILACGRGVEACVLAILLIFETVNRTAQRRSWAC